jgi:hypothetical protein
MSQVPIRLFSECRIWGLGGQIFVSEVVTDTVGILGRGEVRFYWLKRWCRGGELNSLRRPFQGRALPVSYPGTSVDKRLYGRRRIEARGRRWSWRGRFRFSQDSHSWLSGVGSARLNEDSQEWLSYNGSFTLLLLAGIQCERPDRAARRDFGCAVAGRQSASEPRCNCHVLAPIVRVGDGR